MAPAKADLFTNGLLAARFRTSPLFELIAHDQLPAAQREAFQELTAEPSYFGVLLPRTLQLGAKSVDRDTAALLETLRSGGGLADADSPPDAATMARLVLDGVLEIDTGLEFISGPRAWPHVCADAPENEVNGEGRLASLSREALRYAATLPTESPDVLGSRLYHYNAIPAAPRWMARYPDCTSIEETLGIGPRSTLRHLLFESYSEIEHPSWCIWALAGDDGQPPTADLPYKLYISPQPECLAEAFPAAVETLVRVRVPSFKYGRDAFGLLRSDKLIAYLDTWERLAEVTDALARGLTGARAQGVPFSCALTGDGLLSWGMDPPPSFRLLGWQRRESWRSWLTRRLAFAMVQAKAAAGAPVAPSRFAVERLRLDGIDPATWAPAPDLWQDV
jgi:hypothetical protein